MHDALRVARPDQAAQRSADVGRQRGLQPHRVDLDGVPEGILPAKLQAGDAGELGRQFLDCLGRGQRGQGVQGGCLAEADLEWEQASVGPGALDDARYY